MQEAIVILIVAIAAWTVLLRYAPKPVKRGMRAGAARILRKAGMARAAMRFENDAQAGGGCGDGCGSCGGCGSDGADMPKNEFTISADSLRRNARR